MGEQDDLCAVDFPKGETNTELKEHITAALERFKALEHVLVMCDLLSGSPFNTAIMEAMKDARIHVVYGVNLGMLMETTLMRNMGEDIDKLIAQAVTTGKEQIGLFSMPPQSEEDDAFDE